MLHFFGDLIGEVELVHDECEEDRSEHDSSELVQKVNLIMPHTSKPEPHILISRPHATMLDSEHVAVSEVAGGM